MSTTVTPWGYDVDGTVPAILTLQQFHVLTGNKFVSDTRIQSNINAVTARFRNYCGWHIVGPLDCTATMDGGERIVWLPATHVTAIESVTVCGTDVTDQCQWSRRGELRLPYSPDVLRAVVVEYTAGFDTAPDDLMSLVAHRVVHEVALPFGVQQETAGSVSVSYAHSATNTQSAVHLAVSDKAALAAYRLEEVR